MRPGPTRAARPASRSSADSVTIVRHQCAASRSSDEVEPPLGAAGRPERPAVRREDAACAAAPSSAAARRTRKPALAECAVHDVCAPHEPNAASRASAGRPGGARAPARSRAARRRAACERAPTRPTRAGRRVERYRAGSSDSTRSRTWCGTPASSGWRRGASTRMGVADRHRRGLLLSSRRRGTRRRAVDLSELLGRAVAA